MEKKIPGKINLKIPDFFFLEGVEAEKKKYENFINMILKVLIRKRRLVISNNRFLQL